jgi:hypothetical protein
MIYKKNKNSVNKSNENLIFNKNSYKAKLKKIFDLYAQIGESIFTNKIKKKKIH